ncbi:MAG: hypothetical protein K2I79_03515, partial [Clostridia bacterium]|nr:hypothetical protein [Clostridia bacterium]
MKYAFLNCEFASYSAVKGKNASSSHCEVIISETPNDGKCYTIMPRGRQLNSVSRAGLDNFYDFAKDELRRRLKQLLGGRK